MGNRPRDSQKSKVFDVENELRTYLQPSGYDLPAWSQKFIDSAWFRNRVPNFSTLRVTRTSSAGHCVVLGGPYGHSLKLSVARHDQLSVIHALAHVFARIETDRLGVVEPRHGRTFARSFLELVKHVWGNDAANELRRLYQENGVKRISVSEATRQKRSEAWHDRKAAEAQRIWNEFIQSKEHNDV